MNDIFLITIFIVSLALFFNFSNGFHDSANQVATVIASRTLSPEVALTLAAVADFVGAYFLGTNVAHMVGKGIVDPQLIKSSKIAAVVLISALSGALSWNMVTWYLGVPSSSSHALIGALVGAFISGWGIELVQWTHLRNIVIVMLVSPLFCFILTYLFTKSIFFFGQWLTPKANKFFKGLQILSLIAQSLAHGTNDAQKTMGIITFTLIVMGFYNPTVGSKLLIPQWVIFSCSLSMAFGILLGGWRIIKKLGLGLYRIRPIHSLSSQITSASIMCVTTLFGFPISTTHVISSSILGAGASSQPRSVRWTIVGEFAIAWLVTIPTSGLISALIFKLIRNLFFHSPLII